MVFTPNFQSQLLILRILRFKCNLDTSLANELSLAQLSTQCNCQFNYHRPLGKSPHGMEVQRPRRSVGLPLAPVNRLVSLMSLLCCTEKFRRLALHYFALVKGVSHQSAASQTDLYRGQVHQFMHRRFLTINSLQTGQWRYRTERVNRGRLQRSVQKKTNGIIRYGIFSSLLVNHMHEKDQFQRPLRISEQNQGLAEIPTRVILSEYTLSRKSAAHSMNGMPIRRQLSQHPIVRIV